MNILHIIVLGGSYGIRYSVFGIHNLINVSTDSLYTENFE